MSKTLFTADPHFGHENIIKHCKRPFNDVLEMDEVMVERWNAVVSARDTIYILGDLAYRCPVPYAYSLLQRLNGVKHLIVGNHDQLALNIAKYHKGIFASVEQLKEIKVGDQKIVLCHYAMRSWRHDIRGSWQLYGHTHNLLPSFGKSIDVGVDAWDFFPVSFEKIKDVMDKLPIGPHPEFAGYVPEVTNDNQ